MNEFLGQNKVFTQFSESNFTILLVVVKTWCSYQPGGRQWMKLVIRVLGVGITDHQKSWMETLDVLRKHQSEIQQCISRWASQEA